MKRMTMTTTRRLAAGLACAFLLGGCAQYPIFDRSAPQTPGHPKATAVTEREGPPREPARPREPNRARDTENTTPRDASAGLRDGIRMYAEGDYNGAIRRLSARDVASGTVATRVTALKYTAFSYCVTSRPAQCRQAFDRALRLDPNFDLAPGEHGHPLWGPVFTRAKQSIAVR
jgi:hypothetical protein